MNASTNPALVSDQAAQQMPRWAFILFCIAYLLPGLFGRDPWKSADITAFGYMREIATGRTPWLSPELGGLAADGALMPYWLGAVFIKMLDPWVDPALAARVPFTLLLAAVLALTWSAAFHLARTKAAQPLPFAFGGEASSSNYARAIADGALLGQIATLGLLQLGHETTPEMLQLTGAALYLYALAACPFLWLQSRIALLASMAIMAGSGAPSIALGMAAVGGVICLRSHYPLVRPFAAWIVASMALAVGVANTLNSWGWHVHWESSSAQIVSLLRMLAWFTWPAWPLTLWALWSWRHQGMRRHIALPLGCALVGLFASLVMGSYDRALMLAVPSLAVLAAFALPTLGRGTSAAIDWFSVCFFSLASLAIWVVYVAVHTGFPSQPAANVAKLAPGLEHHFHGLSLLFAVLGSAAWAWLVQWRVKRIQHPLWKSLVLPAGGVTLCWLLLMTLWLPMLDYGRSLRPLVQRISAYIPAGECISTPGGAKALVAALGYFGSYNVEASLDSHPSRCNFMIQSETQGEAVSATPLGWMFIAKEKRPTHRDDNFVIYQREPLVLSPK